MMDGEAHHCEQLKIQRELEAILLKSLREPLTPDDARMLADHLGIKLELEMTRKEMT